jgi:DNA (cytosine-5)-methyltransferase 1
MENYKKKMRIIDLFAGIGGFHMAFHNIGAKCVFASEIDPYARMTYEKNFKKLDSEIFKNDMFKGDIQEISLKNIPDFDILCAGFPCQPFSQIGYKRGFQDEQDNRGNMFFEIVKILKVKRPKAFFLENVRHLLKHEEGRTFLTIKETLESMGYSFLHKIVKASDHGLPQHRPRLFMVGFKDETTAETSFAFPPEVPLKLTMSDILDGKCNRKIGYTLRVGGRGSRIDDRRNWEFYWVNGKVRRLGIEEGKKMQGFPKNFEFPVSEIQAMKQLGNSVAVPAIQAVALNIQKYLQKEMSEDRNLFTYEKQEIPAIA